MNSRPLSEVWCLASLSDISPRGASVPVGKSYGGRRWSVVRTMYLGNRMSGIVGESMCRMANQKRG